MPIHNCKMCRGQRYNNGQHCLGCGTELERCEDKAPKSKAPRCPKCQAGSGRELEPGRYCCRNCQAVYEGPDVGFLDDRPHINLEKLERMERELKKGKARR